MQKSSYDVYTFIWMENENEMALKNHLRNDKQFQVELTELFPYMDETELTGDILVNDFDFKKVTVSPEETGEDEITVYYDYTFGDHYSVQLFSEDGTSVRIFDYDKPVWKTVGELKMVALLFDQ